MALIKSATDIELLRKAGQKLARVLKIAEQHTQAGVSLNELDQIIANAIQAEESRPSFLGYEGYPNASCLSVNDQVVHGIPSPYTLKPGDILGIDVGLWYKNVCTDAAISIGIPPMNQTQQRLIEATRQALKAGIKAIKPFRRVGSISAAVQAVAEEYGLGIVTTLTGHGVGHNIHEEPSIPNFGHSTDGIILRPGMVLAIEPMFTSGSGSVYTEIDGWTTVTSDKSDSAHFEHTVVVTSRGAEILTQC